MWEFPSIQVFINAHAVLIGMILLGSFLSAFCGIIFYRSITLNTKESNKEFFINIAVGIVGFGILLLGFWSLVLSYRQTANCRNLDLNQVKAANIRKMTGENTFTYRNIRYEDSSKIREALRSMQNASNTSRTVKKKQREKYTLGYQIQLVLEDDSL